MIPPVHVFFFRGLSTYGHDRAVWSIFDFGPVYKRLASTLTAKGILFHPVLGMGTGSLAEVTNRARLFLAQHPVWRDSRLPVHFLGHSAGGLVARLLTAEAQRPLLSLLTVATPHRGTELAQVCLDMPARQPSSARTLRRFGYDIERRHEFFAELTPESVTRLLSAEPDLAKIVRAASVVCSSSRAEWCLPLRLIYKIEAFAQLTALSDGAVERDSQPFGEVIAELNIDHFRQVGLFGGIGGDRFARLTRELARFFIETQSRA